MKHLLFSLLLAATVAAAEKPAKKPDPVDQIAAWCQPSQVLVYKHVAGRDLELHVFAPKGAQPGKKAKRACFVAIHGGGWQGGEPQRFYPFAECFASQGMLGISVQYRLVKKGEPTTVFNCVEDIRSAMRYIKAHAEELGIDPEKIVVCGGSAGGHLAAATALFDDVNDPQDDLSIDPTPTAMVLLFPVIDTSTEGYGNAKIGDDWKRISPLHRVRAGLPPTLVFHGTGDTTTPFAGAKAFDEAMKAAGNSCELVVHEGGRHGYLMFDGILLDQTLLKTADFLRGLGLLK